MQLRDVTKKVAKKLVSFLYYFFRDFTAYNKHRTQTQLEGLPALPIGKGPGKSEGPSSQCTENILKNFVLVGLGKSAMGLIEPFTRPGQMYRVVIYGVN